MNENYYIVIERVENPSKEDKYIINLRNESVLEEFELNWLDKSEKITEKGISKLEVKELKKQGIEEV